MFVMITGFLEACKEGKPSDLFPAYKISDWGEDLDEKSFADVVDSTKSKPTKSAAVRAAETRAGESMIPWRSLLFVGGKFCHFPHV